MKGEDWSQCPGEGMKAWGLQRQPSRPRPGGGVGHSAHLWDLPSGFPNDHMRPGQSICLLVCSSGKDLVLENV